MRGRALGILTVVAFVLTLLFAVAAGAQESTTDTTETTTPETTTSTSTASATASAEAQTAETTTGAERGSGAFRCELFLRIEQGNGFDGRFGRRFDRRDFAGWRQYFDGFEGFNGVDGDLLVQRIEECREREVLVDTIPDKRLPDTGGSSLALFAAAVLLTTGLGLGVSMWRRRR